MSNGWIVPGFTPDERREHPRRFICDLLAERPGPAGLLAGDSVLVLENATVYEWAGEWLVQAVYGWGGVGQNIQSADYTTVAADARGHILHPSADTTARAFTIAGNADVPYPLDTEIRVINQHDAGIVTLLCADTMYLEGYGEAGSVALAANGTLHARKVEATEWIVTGVPLTGSPAPVLGVDWVALADMPATGGVWAIWLVFGDGVFMATGHAIGGTFVSVSSDKGDTWTNIPLPPPLDTDADYLTAFGNHKFLKTGSSGGVSNTVAMSSDGGTTWATVAAPLGWGQAWDARYGGGAWVVIGQQNNSIYSADDGATWHLSAGLPAGGSDQWAGLGYNALTDTFMTAAFRTEGAVSTDGGQTWAAITLPDPMPGVGVPHDVWWDWLVCSEAGVWCAVAEAIGAIAVSSDDGATWTLRSVPIVGGAGVGSNTNLVRAEGKWILISYNNSVADVAYVSDDDWATHTATAITADYYSYMAYGDGRLLAQAANGHLYRSPR